MLQNYKDYCFLIKHITKNGMMSTGGKNTEQGAIPYAGV